jgi:hypothetical protein
MSEPLTPLERELFRLTAEEHWPGFRMEGLRVTKRENTGVGRYVYLDDTNRQPLAAGDYGAQNRLIEMDGIRNGMSWVVHVSAGRPMYIEMFTFDDPWDGIERAWKVVGGPHE